MNIYAIAELRDGSEDITLESKELHEKVVLKPIEVTENNEVTGGIQHFTNSSNLSIERKHNIFVNSFRLV